MTMNEKFEGIDFRKQQIENDKIMDRANLRTGQIEREAIKAMYESGKRYYLHGVEDTYVTLRDSLCDLNRAEIEAHMDDVDTMADWLDSWRYDLIRKIIRLKEEIRNA